MNNSNFAKIPVLIITRFVNYIMHLIPFIGHFNQLQLFHFIQSFIYMFIYHFYVVVFLGFFCIFLKIEVILTWFYCSENQAKFCQTRVANSEKYLGSLCEVMGSITRKTAHIRDKGKIYFGGFYSFRFSGKIQIFLHVH